MGITSTMIIKKKRHILYLTIFMVLSFVFYQIFFFWKLTDENSKIIPVVDHLKVREFTPVRSEADKFVNINGLFRGVLYSHMAKYRPDSNNEFTCLKSEQKIPFDHVNDDYCDCEDGSDEPSTSACVNGTFYCDTQYRNMPVALNSVPSGQVNDGICDCCDGSDEWLHQPGTLLLSYSSSRFERYLVGKCVNICN